MNSAASTDSEPERPLSRLIGRTRARRPGAARRKRTGGEPAAGAPAQTSAGEAILCERYRRLARGQLDHLPELFKRWTGLECSVCWAPAWSHRWRERDLPSHSRLCRQLGAESAVLRARCRQCLIQHLATSLGSGHAGHRFTCFRGVRNYWLPIILRRCPVGLVFVQALTRSAAGPARGSAKRMGRPEFDQAAKLLQLVCGHVETSALAELRKSDLTQAQQALQALQTVSARLRGELNGLVPAIGKTAPAFRPARRGERVVQVALARIQERYSQPLTLAQCAEELRLNAAYLSALFSRQVGMPFKTYLTEVRIEKARELLSDPARNISEVALAVGYASENRFRGAFKSATGLSPRAWRQTLHQAPPPSAAPAA